MVGMWLPPNAKTLPRAAVPANDVRLGDGRTLRRGELWGDGQASSGYVFAHRQSGMRVIATLDDTEPHGKLLHVSVSYASHDPSWTEIRLIREAFFPNTVDAMMVLPRPEYYVNLAKHAFHLWQTPIGWGLR